MCRTESVTKVAFLVRRGEKVGRRAPALEGGIPGPPACDGLQGAAPCSRGAYGPVQATTTTTMMTANI